MRKFARATTVGEKAAHRSSFSLTVTLRPIALCCFVTLLLISYDSFAIAGLDSGGSGMVAFPQGSNVKVVRDIAQPTVTVTSLNVAAAAAGATMLTTETPRVVVAQKSGRNFLWKKIDLAAGTSETFTTTNSSGVPVVACYRDVLHAAMFSTVGLRSTLKFSGVSRATVTLPSETKKVVCGYPVNGISTAYSLVFQPPYSLRWKDPISNVPVKVNTPTRPQRLKPVGIGTLPLLTGQPAPFVFGSQSGNVQAIHVLGSNKQWQSLTLTGLSTEAKIVNAVGARDGSDYYIVTQLKTGSTFSYDSFQVPASFLTGW